MSNTFLIYLKRGGNAPSVTVTLDGDVDISGSTVEMVLTPTDGTPPLTISTDDGELSIVGPTSFRWSYSEERPERLPSGGRTLADIWRVLGDVREAIGSGVVWVLQAGEALPTTAVSITVPGIQGPPVNVILVEPEDWPPPDDDNPLNWYLRVVA